MLLHYARSAWRTAKKDLVGFSINTIGLTTGFMVFVFAVAFAEYEKTYDTFFEKHERIFTPMVRVKEESRGASWGHMNFYYTGAANAAKEAFGEIEASTVVVNRQWPVKIGNDYFATKLDFTTHDFFNIFDLTFINGDASAFENTAEAAVISRSQAERFFGSTDVIGQVLEINHTVSVRIGGVYEDLPMNSHFTGLEDGPEGLWLYRHNRSP